MQIPVRTLNPWNILRRVLFLIDAERTHHLACFFLRVLVKLRRLKHFRNSHSPIIQMKDQSEHSEDSLYLLGLGFRSRVGLAAGFDKNAELLAALPLFGFGFAEVGTITPQPQSGHERPRLFRDPKSQTLFNRMGFNNVGASQAAEHIRALLPLLPRDFRVGVNIGKNKDTPLEDSHLDYVSCAQKLKDLADYMVINVSSPNTPQLRSLQTIEALKPIIGAVAEELNQVSPGRTSPPLLLKLSPDINLSDLETILIRGKDMGLSGWILTNTHPSTWQHHEKKLEGGISGGKITQKSREVLEIARSLTSLPIISAGGIMTLEEAKTRLTLGADLIQIYTAWIYQGPFFPQHLTKGLPPASNTKPPEHRTP